MPRINEKEAAQQFMTELLNGDYPLERSKNVEVNYCEEKEPRDTEAVKKFIRSKLFAEFRDIT